MPALRQPLAKVQLQQPLLCDSLDEHRVPSACTFVAGTVSEAEREVGDAGALPGCKSCASFIICDDGVVCEAYATNPVQTRANDG